MQNRLSAQPVSQKESICMYMRQTHDTAKKSGRPGYEAAVLQFSRF